MTLYRLSWNPNSPTTIDSLLFYLTYQIGFSPKFEDTNNLLQLFILFRPEN
jgi:hypothetical protein